MLCINLFAMHARYNYFDIISMDVTKMTRSCKLHCGTCTWLGRGKSITELYGRLNYDFMCVCPYAFHSFSLIKRISIFHLMKKIFKILNEIKF